MKYKDKIKLYCITILIDLILISILKIYILNSEEKKFIHLAILVHILFYYGLYFNKRYLLYIIHHFIFILPLISIFLKNKNIKNICLIVLIIVQILWIIEKRCILNENNEELGYGIYTNIGVKTVSIILIYQLLIN